MTYCPTHLHYLMSFACNERCSKCSHWRKRPVDKPLDPSLVIGAFAELPGLEECCIVGGEPLIFDGHVRAIINGARGYGFRTVLITNGVLLTESLVREMASANVHVVVSIDTVEQDAWQWVRGRDTRDRVLSNLRAARKWLGPGQLSVQSVLARETEAHMAGVRALCNELGIYHGVQDYLANGFEGHWTPMPPASRIIPGDQACAAAGRNLSILPNGDVLTCYQQRSIPNCQRPLGTIKEGRISDLLVTDYAQQVLAAMRECDLPCKVLKCNQPEC